MPDKYQIFTQIEEKASYKKKQEIRLHYFILLKKQNER